MDGQTEATARMAYLPPGMALAHPASIGRPVPGRAIRLQPVDGADGPDVGELIYTGPNIMMGYAERPGDLGLGPTRSELRTGDIARRNSDGLFEIIGRNGRFVRTAAS